MRSSHVKNTTRYYLIIVALLLFLFFSGDFGLIDAQKTAIVMAVGIDREEDTFIVTSQIAVPQTSQQGESSKTVQLVSRGKTVADAFEEINSKTGWYPKLVFCKLIILGEQTAKQNVFDALDFFLLDEYLSDSCLVATCDGTAKQLLNTSALIEQSNSSAMQKVLSPHALRVGTALPCSLREFAIGFFSDSKSGYMPLLKTQPQQETIGSETGEQRTPSSQTQQGGQSGKSAQGAEQKSEKNQPVFSASETALFLDGKRVDTLTKEETFAFSSVKNAFKLASFSVQTDEGFFTLTVKDSKGKSKLKLTGDDTPLLNVRVTLTAGILDYSRSLSLDATKNAGAVPDFVFSGAESLLSAQIESTFEKCKSCGCDLFGVQEKIQKYNAKKYEKLKNDALKNARIQASVIFRGIR